MKKLPTASDSTGSGTIKTHQSTSLYLIATMADTTWRMFVPTIGLLLVGKALDDRLGTKPLLLLTGIVVGGAIAAYLIKRQLRKDI